MTSASLLRIPGTRLTHAGLCAVFVTTVIIAAGCSSSPPATRTKPGGGPTAGTAVRNRIVAEARTWLGTRYRFGGNSRAGTDCSGFTTSVFARMNVDLPRTAREMYGVGRAVSARALRPGDLVFFRNTAGRGITHVGIYVGRGSFIHASTRQGVITSSLDDAYYSAHYAGARNVLD